MKPRTYLKASYDFSEDKNARETIKELSDTETSLLDESDLMQIKQTVMD